jgi:hypothetical protein
LLVISRDSTFAYRTVTTDLRSVARALGPRYVLHGSVRREGERLRINAMLTDTGDGRELWAERFDGRMAEVFKLQDEITRKIAAALTVTLTQAERRRLAREETGTLQACERFLKGEELFFRYARTSNSEARQVFRQATALDPGFARLRHARLDPHLRHHEWLERRSRALVARRRAPCHVGARA